METMLAIIFAGFGLVTLMSLAANKRKALVACSTLVGAMVLWGLVFTGGQQTAQYSAEPGFTESVILPGQQQSEILNGAAISTYSYQGYVLDRQTQEPIAGTEVIALLYRNPADEQLVASIGGMNGLQIPRMSESLGESQVVRIATDESGFYQFDANRYEQVSLVASAPGHHDQDTRIFLTEGQHQVDIYPSGSNQPAPLPANQASFVVNEGFRNESGQALSSDDLLKERAVAGLQCQGFDISVDDILDIEEIEDFTGVFKTSVLLKSDDCSSIEARTVDYSSRPSDVKSVKTTKGTFTLVDRCVNLIIPAPEGFLKIFKYEDLNGNGQFDDGEPGVPGFHFRVDGEGQSFEITTGNGGVWISDGLPAGDYTVTEINIPDGWEPTTPTEQTVEVEDGEIAEVRFGNKQVPTPSVDIIGEKVWLVGDSEFPPDVAFTFEIIGKGLTTQTNESGEFRFEDVIVFTPDGPEEVEIRICEHLPDLFWEAVDPPDGCKTITVKKSDLLVDAGKWKNRTLKEPRTLTPTPSVTPTPTPSPTPTVTPSPTPTKSPTPTPSVTPTPTPSPTPTPTQPPLQIGGCVEWYEHHEDPSQIFWRQASYFVTQPVASWTVWTSSGQYDLTVSDDTNGASGNKRHAKVVAKEGDTVKVWANLNSGNTVLVCESKVTESIQGATPEPSRTPAPTPTPTPVGTDPTPSPQWTPPPP